MLAIFGYGSILWKVDFPYEERVVGFIKGYVRRFYQNSTDHRGIPEKPGRVVTLLTSSNKEEQVWGIAYGIANDKVDQVMNHLDYRERGGYERKVTSFYPQDGSKPFDVCFYCATEQNRQYAGESSIEDIAAQIVGATGPSGSNLDYVLHLATTMRKIAPGVDDPHLFAVESAVKKIICER